MGGAESKPRQVPARLLKTLKGRHGVSVPNNTQDTTHQSVHKNTQREETATDEKDQPCCNEETNDKSIESSDIIPLETKLPDSSKILLESTSANTEKLASCVENNSLRENALFYQYKDHAEWTIHATRTCQEEQYMLSECPLTHVQECSSRCQVLHLMNPDIPFESTNMLPKCSSFDALNPCNNDRNGLMPYSDHDNSIKMQPQNDDSKLFEVSQNQCRIKRNKYVKLHDSALKSASANSLASRPCRRVQCSENNDHMEPLTKSVSFNEIKKTPSLPVKRNRSLKFPSKSVTFDLTHTRWSGPVPSRRNLKPPLGVASSGVLKRRNSLPGTNQPQPLKSCLKLPVQDSLDSIPKKPTRLRSGPLNRRDAKNWIIYYKNYLDALKIVPGMCGSSLHEGQHIRSPELGLLADSEFRNLFGSDTNPPSNEPRCSSGSTNIGDISPGSGLTDLGFKAVQPKCKSPQPVLKRNSNRNIKENQKLEKEQPVGSFVVVEMDETGYSINRSEGGRRIEVRRLGKNWRSLKGGPTHIMDMLMRQKSKCNIGTVKKEASKTDLEYDERSGKRRRESSHSNHRRNQREGLHRQREGRDHRRNERRTDGFKENKDDAPRDRHKYVQRERSKSRGERQRIAHLENEKDISRVQRGHGEGLSEDNEDHKDVKRKSHGEYHRKIHKEVKKDKHRKSRKENYGDGHSGGHHRRHGEDNREEHREKHRDVYLERNRDEQRDSGRKRHKEKERFNLYGKERDKRYLEDKTSEHAIHNREKPNSFLQKIRRAESISKKSRKEGGNSESNISDSSQASVYDTKDFRSKKRKNRGKDNKFRKKNIEDY